MTGHSPIKTFCNLFSIVSAAAYMFFLKSPGNEFKASPTPFDNQFNEGAIIKCRDHFVLLSSDIYFVYNVSRTRRDHFVDLTFIVSRGLWNFYLQAKLVDNARKGFRKQSIFISAEWINKEWATKRLYLCIILDLYSRKAVGLSKGSRTSTSPYCHCVTIAMTYRNPREGLIFQLISPLPDLTIFYWESLFDYIF